MNVLKVALNTDLFLSINIQAFRTVTFVPHPVRSSVISLKCSYFSRPGLGYTVLPRNTIFFF